MEEDAPLELPDQRSPLTTARSGLRQWLDKRTHLDWFGRIIFQPRKTLTAISKKTESFWLPPLLLLTITAVLLSLAAGYLRQQAVSSGEISYPPGFEYYTPEQQAQFLQAAQATSGPIFIYLIPMVGTISRVWLDLLVISGILHLLVTMLGGRGTTATTVNIVAWSGIPFALRDLLRTGNLLITGSQITMSGLSGFIVSPGSPFLIYLSEFLAAVDIFLVWSIVLMIIGIDCATRLPKPKVLAGVLLTIVFVLALQALFGFLLILLSDLSVVRPFMF